MRCFLAVDLPPEIIESIAEVQAEAKKLGLTATWPGENEMHATLAFYGLLDGNAVRKKIDELSTVRFKPFEARVRGLGFFPSALRPRVFWAAIQGLEGLQAETAQATGYDEGRPFHGHVTLCRLKAAVNADKLRKLAEKIADKDFGAFTVDEFVLKESKLSPKGPTYYPIQKFRAASSN